MWLTGLIAGGTFDGEKLLIIIACCVSHKAASSKFPLQLLKASEQSSVRKPRAFSFSS